MFPVKMQKADMIIAQSEKETSQDYFILHIGNY